MADEADRKALTNERIAYIGPIAQQLTDERTSLESKIIPVSAYIVTACIESFLRYPEMMRRIDAAMPAEQIGARADAQPPHAALEVDEQIGNRFRS